MIRKRLAEPVPLTYHSGDHVGIMAENRRELVDAILDRLVNKPSSSDEPVQLQLMQEKYTPMGAYNYMIFYKTIEICITEIWLIIDYRSTKAVGATRSFAKMQFTPNVYSLFGHNYTSKI